MSIFTSTKENKSKVHFSEYLRNQNEPVDVPKPTEETKPADTVEGDEKPETTLAPATG